MFKVTGYDLKKNMNMTDKNNHDITLQGFVNEIKSIINTARSNAVRSVDFCRVQMYWAIGQRIVEKEQQGYGAQNEAYKCPLSEKIVNNLCLS